MKFVWFVIFIFVVGIGFFGKREARNVPGAPPLPEATVTAPRIPTAVGIALGPSLPSGSTSPLAPEDIHPRLEKITELARYALPNQNMRDTLIQNLSAPELHSALGRPGEVLIHKH